MVCHGGRGLAFDEAYSLALKRQYCFDVQDRHQREAGKSAIGLNVPIFEN